MYKGEGCQIGQGVIFQDDTQLGDHVVVGNHVTFYPGVSIGDGCNILDGAVIGRRPIATGGLSLSINAEFHSVSIGQNSVIGSNCVIYTDNKIGSDVLIGDLTSIREGGCIGNAVVVGQQVSLHSGANIGNRVRISYNCMTGGVIEEDAFLGAGVSSADDNNVYLSRFGLRHAQSKSPIIRRFSVVGAGATLMPAVEIGIGAFVAGGATVTRDVAAWTMAGGNPAKYLRDIPDNWRNKVLEYAKKHEV